MQMCSWCVWTATGASLVWFTSASTDFISVALGMCIFIFLCYIYKYCISLLYYFTYNVKDSSVLTVRSTVLLPSRNQAISRVC